VLEVIQKSKTGNDLVEDEVFIEVALFLSSANVALRTSLALLYDHRRDLMITRSEKPLNEGLEAIKHMFSTRIFNQPMLFGSEIPFQLCTEGPKALCENWANTVKSTQVQLLSKISNTLEANLQMFAHAKAFRGVSKTEEKDDVQFEDVDSKSNYDLGYGFLYEKEYSFEDDMSENMIIGENGAIKCATLDKLVERMTSEQVQDLNLLYVFLLTYHSFSNENQVLEKLIQRFQIPPPLNITTSEYEYFQNVREKHIRLKVLGVLNFWIQEHYSDFENNHELRELVRTHLKTTFSDLPFYEKFSKTILERLTKEEIKATRLKSQEFRLPKFFDDKAEMKKFQENFLDQDDHKIAEQITWKDYEIFRRIHPRECLNQNWTKTNKSKLAPNIVALIDRYNCINNWAQTFILSNENERNRAQCLAKIIKLAECFKNQSNFNALAAIYYALESNAVHRLRKTWDSIPTKIRAIWDDIKTNLFSNKHNSKNLRKALDTQSPPCVLYIGLFLKDLTFFEDGNPDTLKGMINWYKRCKLAERIQRIKQCQQVPYNIIPIPLYQKYFQSQIFVSKNDDELWKISCELEPPQQRN
jgi:hypothetical protein